MKGCASTLLYLIDHLPGKDRVYVGVAPPFPNMQFDGRKVVRPGRPRRTRRPPKRRRIFWDLLSWWLLARRLGEIDVCHRRLHPSQVLSDQQGIRVVPAGSEPREVDTPVLRLVTVIVGPPTPSKPETEVPVDSLTGAGGRRPSTLPFEVVATTRAFRSSARRSAIPPLLDDIVTSPRTAEISVDIGAV